MIILTIFTDAIAKKDEPDFMQFACCRWFASELQVVNRLFAFRHSVPFPINFRGSTDGRTDPSIEMRGRI